MTFDDSESEELDEFVERHEMIERFSRKTLNSTKARIRNALSRESAMSEKRNAEMAAYLLNHIENAQYTKETEYTRRAREQHAVVVGISRLTASVLNSIDVNVPIIIEKANSTNIANAKTNFSQIVIGVRNGVYKEDDRKAVSSLIHLVKGLVYHEGGHIKFTTPFNALVEMSGFDLPASHRFSLMNAWNILEDQRMETAMCKLSPVLAKYFTTIVVNVVVNRVDIGSNWPWLVGRTYLPSSIRQLFRDAAEQHPQSHLIPRINDCVMRYRKSTDAKEMVKCVLEFVNLLSTWGGGGRSADEHNNFGVYNKEEGVPRPDGIPPPDHYEIEEAGGKDPGDEPQDEEEERPAPRITADEGNDASKSSGAPAPKSEEIPDVEEERQKEKERLEREAHKALQQELENNSGASDDEIDSFIASVNEIKATSVMPDRTVSPMNDNEIAKSKEVANSMLSVLERLFVQVEPTWSLYQEDGVLDPTAYTMREPGDINFWSGLDGSGGSGHDIAVSVLLDSSGSMQNNMDRVSIAAMGIRHACDQLGIPCTVTTFNDDVYMVAPANEDVGFVRVSAEGGTSVLNAMMAIEEQKCGRTYHLVIILTDGEWFDVSDVRLWSQPQRHIVIAGFGYGLEKYVSDKRADHWVVLTNPLELPNLVTDSLIKQFV